MSYSVYLSDCTHQSSLNSQHSYHSHHLYRSITAVKYIIAPDCLQLYKHNITSHWYWYTHTQCSVELLTLPGRSLSIRVPFCQVTRGAGTPLVRHGNSTDEPSFTFSSIWRSFSMRGGTTHNYRQRVNHRPVTARINTARTRHLM